MKNVQILQTIYSNLLPILLKYHSDFAQKSVQLCDDWWLYCAPEMSQDIGNTAAKREIVLRRICPLADCVRQAMDWLMPFDAPATARVSLPLVALSQACLLYESLPFGVA